MYLRNILYLFSTNYVLAAGRSCTTQEMADMMLDKISVANLVDIHTYILRSYVSDCAGWIWSANILRYC